MSETILFLAHAAGGAIARADLEALAAATALAQQIPGATLVAGLAGDGAAFAASAIAGSGAARVLAVEGPEFAEPRYATDALAAEALARAAGATIVVAAGTSRWMRVLPGVAHRLGGRVETHLTGVRAEGGQVFVSRWYYRQRMEAVLTRAHRPWVLVVDPGCAEPWKGAAGAAAVAVEPVAVAVPDGARRTQVEGVRAASSGAQTIRPDAAVLFVAGAGWTKKQADGKVHAEDAQKLILGFIDAAGASLGGSKSVVDQSGEGQAVLPFMTHLNQVGQTGATPRHPKGLATCCHGEEPHTVGWRFINERRAVNLDPGCGWSRGKADVLYVADAFAVMARVNELLEARK